MFSAVLYEAAAEPGLRILQVTKSHVSCVLLTSTGSLGKKVTRMVDSSHDTKLCACILQCWLHIITCGARRKATKNNEDVMIYARIGKSMLCINNRKPLSTHFKMMFNWRILTALGSFFKVFKQSRL